MSLGNEQDSCGSISALIGQFDSTIDQNHLTPISHNHTPFRPSNLRPSTLKLLQDLQSPLRNNTISDQKHLISPQKLNQKSNHVKHESPSLPNSPAPAIFSSPETAELEDVYTILDEEVLLPVSVYNLKKQTVHVQAGTMESTPSNSLGSSPVKMVQGLGKSHSVAWDGHNERGRSEEVEEPEESVYEEVYDPPAAVREIGRSSSNRYIGSSVNNPFHFLSDSVGNAFEEVEINVDEEPLEMMLTSKRHGSQWEGLISPTKRHAIYENQESTSNYSQQKDLSSYRDPQQEYSSHTSQVTFTHCSSPINQPYQLSNHHQLLNNSPLYRSANSRPSNPSPLRQNSYPVPQSNSETNHRDFSCSYRQQSCSGSQILNRSHQDSLGHKLMEREQVRNFHNGFSSFESLPAQSAVAKNICRDRGLYSPSSECDAVYSHLDYSCITPSPSSAPKNTQPHCQSQTKAYSPNHQWNQKIPLNNTSFQLQSESRVSLHTNLGPLSTKLQPGTIDSTTPSPCKSKSLGDLTSEDISCNFQSKYHIISRSFITPNMRKQKRMGTMGEVTFQSQSCDPLTEQLRKLVSLESDDSERDRPQPPQLHLETKSLLSQPQATSNAPVVPRDGEDSPPLLTRRLSSRSQSRVRHINSRARERQQEALKPRAGVVINSTTSLGGVVLRNKPASQNPPANRHSTGSYIAGYLGQLEDRGLPEGACTALRYGNGDHYGDRYYTDDSLPPVDSNHSASEPEVYFLLRL